jgi:P27 family predicted phage terminase small subunit
MKETTYLPPDHLDDSAKQKWAELLPILLERGTLDASTLDGLTCYVTAWSQWTDATAQVQQLGMVVKSAAGFAIVSPYVTVAAQAERRMRQWADALQITPKSRGRKKAEPESEVMQIMRELDDQDQGGRRKATA